MNSLIGWLAALGALGGGVFLMTRSHGGGRLSGSVRRRRGLRGADEQHELQLYIDNDEGLYRQSMTPIQKNLITKMARGVYDHEKAKKLWMYLVENGAKKYAKEFGSEFISDREGVPWNKMFSMEDRRAVAKDFAEQFEEQAKNGEYDHLLPKKYQKRA